VVNEGRMVRLDIITVNWNSGEQLKACLESIPPACRNSFTLSRVVVVDNASTDGSADALDDVPVPLTVIRNSENRGFAAACNQGARGSQAECLLFLNPDTRLLEDSLATPLAFMEKQENRNVGVVGIQLIDQRGDVSRIGTAFRTPATLMLEIVGLHRLLPSRFLPASMIEWDHLTTREVDHVTGAFFLVRRPLFEMLGGLDERYFVYFEDVDFCADAKQAGWTTLYLAGVRAFHKGGGTGERVKASRLFYSLRSRIHYAYKHFGWWSATAILFTTLFVEPVVRVAYAVARGSGENISATFGGIFRLWMGLPAIFRDIRRFGPANRERISLKAAPGCQGQ